MEFCSERQINCFQSTVDNVINFLTSLFNLGYKYDALNTARSALSALCVTEEGFTAGSHPLVVRYMSGVFNLRPSKCKYQETWDVSKVLCYLKSMPPVCKLKLKELTLKLCVLLALTQASRAHSLSLISLEGLRKDQNCFYLQYCGLLKQSRKGKRNPLLIVKKYLPDEKLCVYRTLVEYIERTRNVRKSEQKLFISYLKPHRPVTSSTISRWIKSVLKYSGIDIQKFQSHSVRGASTSTAKMVGVPINDILKVAGWSNEQTFAAYYNKPVQGVDYEDAVLGRASGDSLD